MKIMLIDDDKLSIFLTHQLLLVQGFVEDIKIFNSASKALFFLQKVAPSDYFPDVILLDLVMPEMDGAEFLKQVNMGLDKHKKIKVCILSNSLNQQLIEKAHSYANVVQHINKPLSMINFKTLLEKI